MWSALRTGRLYAPGDNPGTHFCWRLSRPQGHCAAERTMSMKNSNDTTGNRTCDLPVCSAVPQPTAPPRTERSLMFFKCRHSNSFTAVTIKSVFNLSWPRTFWDRFASWRISMVPRAMTLYGGSVRSLKDFASKTHTYTIHLPSSHIYFTQQKSGRCRCTGGEDQWVYCRTVTLTLPEEWPFDMWLRVVLCSVTSVPEQSTDCVFRIKMESAACF